MYSYIDFNRDGIKPEVELSKVLDRVELFYKLAYRKGWTPKDGKYRSDAEIKLDKINR